MFGSAHIKVINLAMAYGNHVVLHGLNFTINVGEIFIIMGSSGCGKSTLLRHLTGLKEPDKGTIQYGDINFWGSSAQIREQLMRKAGVLYQSGALWTSMTLAENIALPLQEYTDLSATRISEIVSYKLSLVGLTGFEKFYPAELSGGMQKRASLARAIALDPEILFFDEPSAGLDPISAKLLDNLILELRASLGATIVVVTHELDSIFTIADDSVFLDPETKTQIALGNPMTLLKESEDPKITAFLTRGETRFQQGH